MPFQKGNVPWNKGKTLSEETRRRMSQGHKGQKCSDETRAKMSEVRKGRPKTEDHKRKLSDSLRGRPSPMKGKHHSAETKRKIAEGNKGRSVSEETRRKIREACKKHTPWNKGKKSGAMSEEQKQKLRAIVKAAWLAGIYDNRKPRTPYVTYKGISMRSSWEVRLAEAFDRLGWLWEYEAHKFQYVLDDGKHTYVPDFYVRHLDCYFDPHHSHWGQRYVGKFNAVREQCNIALIVLNEQLLAMYEQVASLTK